MKNPPQKIKLNEIKDALLRSGYLLENRLETFLIKQGYSVVANEAYPDPITEKTRELDLFADSIFAVGDEEDNYIIPALIIECINPPQPIAFITKEPQTPWMYQHDIHLAGLPIKIFENKEKEIWAPLQGYLQFSRFHHYCNNRISTQFCTFTLKGKSGKRKDKEEKHDEWMAFHEEKHFDSFRKLSNVIEYHKDKFYREFINPIYSIISVQILYPILVVQGELIDVRPGKTSLKTLQAKHIQFSQTVISKGKEINYQIDVVTESYFPKFLKLIEGEIKQTIQLFQKNEKALKRSVRKLIPIIRREGSPEKFRSILEI